MFDRSIICNKQNKVRFSFLNAKPKHNIFYQFKEISYLLCIVTMVTLTVTSDIVLAK